jgi:hypothetical protein
MGEEHSAYVGMYARMHVQMRVRIAGVRSTILNSISAEPTIVEGMLSLK